MITLLVLVSLYFLPTIVAAQRGRGAGVLVLNLFFGWTVIGWFALLLWALLSRPRCVYYPVPYGKVVYDRRYL
ncbi:superinfection immunity protein [Granulicella arctica]|uniref:superinfection immunity protein n=1 Tax=Granulicella arctica TaxID=940613 RepID=UPI0021DFAC82|nr:superinfection immunity protein [Granulicella arctica]